MTHGQAEDAALRPAHFLQRGALLPFKNERLQGVRIRQPDPDRAATELVVPSFSGSGDVYVMPTKSVADLVTLGVYDGELLERVLELDGVDPCAIKRLSLEIAASSFLGERKKRAADRALAAQHQRREEALVVLVTTLLREAGAANAIREIIASDDASRDVKRHLRAWATKNKLNVDDLVSSVEDWAGWIAPIGLPQLNAPLEEDELLDPFRCRASAARLTAVGDELQGWAKGKAPEAAFNATALGEVMAASGGRAGDQIAEADAFAARVGETLKDWPASGRAIRAAAALAAWYADGWDVVEKRWAEARLEGFAEQRVALEEMLVLAPAMPQMAADDGCFDRLHRRALDRRVAAQVDWSTGEKVEMGTA